MLAIAELQYATPTSGDKASGGGQLPGNYKIGFWYDSENFADLRYDTAGLPVGNPANNQTPASHRGDYAFYAVADQMIWRAANPDRNLDIFVRPMFTPLEDRNLINFGLNAGLTLHEPIDGRKDDTAGVGLGIAQVSSSASGLAQDAAFYNPRDIFAAKERGDLPGGYVPIPGHGMVAVAAGHSIFLQSRRRDRRSKRPDAKDRERAGDRPAHQHHFLASTLRVASAMANRILVFYGSYRSDRMGIRLANYVLEGFRARGDDVEFIDAKVVGLPMLDRMYKEYPKGSAPAAMEKLAAQIRSADGFIFIAGEYNWGVQPGLKNLTDHFLEEWFWRPAAIASYSGGRLSGAHAATAWHGTLSEMGMIVVSSSLSVGPISKALSDKGEPIGEDGKRLGHAFVSFADDLSWWVEAAKAQRAKKPPPY